MLADVNQLASIIILILYTTQLRHFGTIRIYIYILTSIKNYKTGVILLSADQGLKKYSDFFQFGRLLLN